MDVPIKSDTKFVSVDYPCIVNNDQKMLDTLGGEKSISKGFYDPTRRVELRMRPEDVFCKPLCGDKGKCNGLLMKIRRRKKPRAAGTSEDSEQYEHKAEILGLVANEVKFDSLADFQYLPMQKGQDGNYTPLVDDLVLKKMEPRSWMEKDAPLFIPPPIFSRIDKPVDYCYRDGPKSRLPEKNTNIGSQPNFIGITRQRRPHYTKFMTFEDKEIPSDPYPEAVDKLQQKLKDTAKLDEVKRMFEERPVWSKNALRCKVDLTAEQFKYVLPTIAYYYVTGPWRTFWIKLGYDPRAEATSKLYQTLDFRVRQKGAGDKVKIAPKRSTYSYSLPNTVYKPSATTAIIRSETFNQDYSKDNGDESNNKGNRESMYKFRRGLIPAYRQMFYQLCDVDVPEVQKLVHANDGKETECTERDGWCETDCIDKCREILASILKEELNEDRPAEQFVDLHSIKPAGSKKGKGGKKHQAKQSTSRSARIIEGVGTPVANDSMDVDRDSSDSDGDLDVNDDEEQNEMETEMLEYMDPQFLDS